MGKQSDRPENTTGRKNDEPWQVGKGFVEEVTSDLCLDSEVEINKMQMYSVSCKGIVCSLHTHFKSTYRKKYSFITFDLYSMYQALIVCQEMWVMLNIQWRTVHKSSLPSTNSLGRQNPLQAITLTVTVYQS